ncbi:MAG: hypothetical protein M5U09_12530 [Gammaproteobacteria bacterium]|nr:hypothetical protein [Gammaproteobacteria bacterium]
MTSDKPAVRYRRLLDPVAIETAKENLLNLLANGVMKNPSRAATSLGISPRAVAAWKANDPEFAEALDWAIKTARAADVDALEQAMLRNALENDNVSAQKVLLQAWDPETYQLKPYASLQPPPSDPNMIDATFREKPKRIHELPQGTAPEEDDSRSS